MSFFLGLCAFYFFVSAACHIHGPSVAPVIAGWHILFFLRDLALCCASIYFLVHV